MSGGEQTNLRRGVSSFFRFDIIMWRLQDVTLKNFKV